MLFNSSTPLILPIHLSMLLEVAEVILLKLQLIYKNIDSA